MKIHLPEIASKPVIEKISVSCAPEELFRHFCEYPDSALLNSSLETDAGRYSFIGIHPFKVITGGIDPFTCLKTVIDAYSVQNDTKMPFISGGIGYLSYDLKDHLETLPQKSKNDLNIPEIYFVFYQTILIHDRHDPCHIYVSVLDINSAKHNNQRNIIKEIKNTIKNIPAKTPISPVTQKAIFESNFSKERYIGSIEKIIEHIRAGDIYQVCLSQRFKTHWNAAPYELYIKLNRINPSPFSAYLNFGEHKVISSSPERFIKFSDNTIETRPMKGTRPRGTDTVEDEWLKNDLEKSPKDTAELAMIVDLERNDLGRVAIPGSVEVLEHKRIETYSTVFQTIAVVKARVKTGTSPVEIIKAAFPGGSITGCPKIRAMEIIDALEPTRRGIYTGAIGYISFHNTMDLNVAIRTMLMKNNNIYFQSGGGIVADSDPGSEYTETLHKARALMDSLSS